MTNPNFSGFSLSQASAFRNGNVSGANRGVTLAWIVALALLLSLGLASPARANDSPAYSYARIVRLSYVNGDVQIVRTDKSKNWEPAVMNMPVEQGFAIGTNDGRAEVEFEHGSRLWLAPNSIVQFTELALSNGGRITRMTLSEGVATFEASLSEGDAFEVTTPLFTVHPGKKAEFRVGVRDKDAGVNVLNGELSVADNGKTEAVAKGHMFVAQREKKNQEAALLPSPATDDWDRWVNGRLNAETVAENQAALSANSPFTYGMADLSEYGSWSFFPGYGYGWQPFGMNAGWAPYMDGQWMYYPTFGWTWLSAEPWGWVPYHFGGWEYSPAFGWMWMPGSYGTWTAAPVEWYGFGNRIGWAPRGVNVPHPGSAASPVVVSTKTLGKEGRNRVYSASEVSANMQSLRMRSLDGEPAQNGKAWPVGAVRPSSARVVVPTAGTLGALRAGLAANAAARVNIRALREPAASHAAMAEDPERNFNPVNAAMAAPRLSSRPPTRAAFGPPEGWDSRGYGEPSLSRSASSVGLPGPGNAAAPSASHPASPSSGGTGRPR